jgi:outer membrane biosynthesis protein TonB
MKRYLSVVLVSVALFAVGCTRLGIGGHTDTQVTADVQSKITGDSNVPDKQLTISASNGVVTLSGNVSSDFARSAAASDAAQVAGVRTVVNNLQVTPPVAATNVPPPEQTQPQETSSSYPPPPAPAPRDTRRPSPRKYSDGPRSRDVARNNGQANSSDDESRTPEPEPIHHDHDQEAQQAPPPQPAPAPQQKITVPSGTQISISLTQELNSEVAQVGDIFHASVSSPVMVDGQTIIPTTADIEGRVVDVKSAGRFAGQSDLVLELNKLLMNGTTYSLQTDRWSKQGNGRGKATAAKVGGGAAVGAILGGIFGGGKGAAIGAAAGAGAGTGVSAATKGQQIILKPETVLSFQLQAPIAVTPGAGASHRPLDQHQ